MYISLLTIRCKWLSCQCNSRPSMALVNTVRLGLDKESRERKKGGSSTMGNLKL